jgi:hypothetical protein
MLCTAKAGAWLPHSKGQSPALGTRQKNFPDSIGLVASASGGHGQQAARGTRKSRSWGVFLIAVEPLLFGLSPSISSGQAMQGEVKGQ